MRLLALIGDRANEVAKAIGLDKTNNTEINNAIESLANNGYKRYRLMRISYGISDYPNCAETLCIPIEIDKYNRSQVSEILDHIKQENKRFIPIETVAVIWDHYLYDSREYATWFGIDEDASIESVNLAVNKCLEFETTELVPHCDHTFKLSRLTNNNYVTNFIINTDVGE